MECSDTSERETTIMVTHSQSRIRAASALQQAIVCQSMFQESGTRPVDAAGGSLIGFGVRGRLCSRPLSSTTVEHVKRHSLHATRGCCCIWFARGLE